ncbi:MAG: hypothetical protein KatS3mg108_1984 [Isosphaeraceae bacterium]|jgi:carbon storage regulator|nr:MAG: hypothetical protein KatS3mg108_1984 [Isosphaeraceae bacterium]
MLVLSRKLNQKLVIGGNIEITVVRIDGQSVRLGVQAPPDVQILREEILQKSPNADMTPLAMAASAVVVP